MAFDNLIPQSREFIMALAGNVVAGTHSPQIIRYSGSVNDPRPRLVQKALPGNEDFVILMEGYGAGEALQRLIPKGFLQGGWVDADTWEGTVQEAALTEFKTGA